MMPEEQKPYEIVPIKGMKPSKPVSLSEDKTAEQIIEKIKKQLAKEHIQDWNESDTLYAMKQFGSLRWNKAIEEAMGKVKEIFIERWGKFTDSKIFDEVISELNKMKV